ncbi:error-prone DNA polymerase [Gilvimarinus sp. F26214L]|uniref:error-prone DNA polymerase n=1 Tax=Gilvimarinus sp. DZF01 TaxID=3461371 RepID=UPI004045CE75
MSRFAELHAISNFSFLRGASHPEELVLRAAELGYEAIAITDECSFAGIVRAHVAARDLRQTGTSIKLIIGSEFHIHSQQTITGDAGPDLHLVLLCPNRKAYAEVSGLISRARRRSEKGSYRLHLSDLQFGTQHCLAIWLPQAGQSEQPDYAPILASYFRDRLWLGLEMLQDDDDQQHYLNCQQMADALNLPMVACNNVHMHDPLRKPLQDVLTGIRLGKPVQELGREKRSNGENYLRLLDTLDCIYPQALMEEACRIADYCHFSLDELRYEYPEEIVPKGTSPSAYLRQLVMEGARKRWPRGHAPHLQAQIDKELQLIAELEYEHYFLTVYDLVQFARTQKILCQGRGSAANSVVCYCLFITEVDPVQSELLFERFISKERDEPPDIDVDFEHERREEVIQYIYNKYTRKRAALAATVITYRRRSAVRDVGKALGLDDILVDKLSKSLARWDKSRQLQNEFKASGLTHSSQLARQFLYLVNEILGFPRHLSQHVGGFLIARSPISTLVPVENAAMPDRTIIQWDKTDIESLGLLKVDVLALGMLTAIRKSVDLLNSYLQKPITVADIPNEDPKTYDMLCRGDSMGVFQVESRAQMSMLPRLKPRTYYDLVIQIAIIRPGPIQGDMVHPFLRRRDGEEEADYFSEELKPVLERTLGIPIFQEQVIRIAMVAAGFSGGEADALRRAMASWGRNGHLAPFKEKLIDGMLAKGYDRSFAERIFRQIQGFGEYGFPESHSASFALLAYQSAWLKCHYPAAFYCGLLNSLPMGFYSASQLIQDARRHNIEVLPVDVMHSTWDHQLVHENNNPVLESWPSIRLGFRIVKGFSESGAERVQVARSEQAFTNGHDLANRAGLNQKELSSLVAADALQSISGHRHQAHWNTQAVAGPTPLLGLSDRSDTSSVELAEPSPQATTAMDYDSMGLTLNKHPLALLRRHSPFDRCRRAIDLYTLNTGRFVRVAGVVTGRQRPGTASGVIFMTLEDETGNMNVIVWREQQRRFRQAVLTGQLLMIKGVVEREGSVVHVVAGEIIDMGEELPALKTQSRDFH